MNAQVQEAICELLKERRSFIIDKYTKFDDLAEDSKDLVTHIDALLEVFDY